MNMEIAPVIKCKQFFSASRNIRMHFTPSATTGAFAALNAMQRVCMRNYLLFTSLMNEWMQFESAHWVPVVRVGCGEYDG